MARVPMVPEAKVRQSASPLSPNPPPGAFGAVGDSLAVLGKAAGGVSDAFAERAEKIAAIDNRVESDAAALRVSQRQNEFLVKYKTENQGVRAKPNLPDAFRQLEAIRTEEGANLFSPAARDMFNSQTRIGTAQATGNLSAFAASEWLRTTNDSIDAQVNNAQREMNAANFGLGVAAITNQAALKAEVNGWTEAQAKEYIAKNVGDAAWSITSNIAPVDPKAAQEFLDANKQWMTPQQQGDVTAKIRSSRENMLVAEVAQSTLAAVMGGTVARREAIAGIESAGSGDYSAVGKRTRSGDRAYGRYQVMGANIPKWTKQVLGKSMTPQEFLANPAAQDRVFDTIFGGYVERYGSEAEAASRWFTGRSVAEGAKLADVNGMTGAEYVRRFSAGLSEGGVDRAEAQALAGYNAIGEQISDPRLRDRAQTEFLARLGQQRQIDALRTGEARERLQGAINAGVTSVAALQKAYPGALEDWNTVGPRGQQQVQNAMLASASQVTPERHAKYLELLGFAGSSPAKFSQLDLSAYNITPSQHTELFKKQQSIIKAKEKETWQNVTLGKVLGNELVKSAIVRAGIEKDTPEWYQFNGALLGEIAAWGEANPGKKPTDKDFQAMAAGVLANSDRAMVTRVLGFEVGRQPIRRFQTGEYTEGTRPDDPNMAQLYDVFSKREGRAPTPEEMSYMVYRSR